MSEPGRRRELPSNWERATLGDVCQWVSGGTPSRSDSSNFGGTIPWVTISDLNDGLIVKTKEFLSERGVSCSSARLVPSGSVLLALYGSIGKLGILRDESATNQAIACAIPAPDILESRYLFYYLRYSRLDLAALGSGVTQKNIYLGDLKAFAIPIAPLAEQSRVVARLDELLGEMDAGVEDLRSATRKLALYRQSLLKSAVEGTLTAEWRGEPTDIDTETPAASPEGWAEIPNSWRWSTAESRCGFITKGTTPPKSLTGDSAKCVPFLRVTNLTHDGSLNFSDQVFVAKDVHRKLLARSIVKPGDVLMNIVGPPLGQVSLVPATFPEWNVNQAIAIFRIQAGLLNEFLAYVLLSPGAGRWLQARAKTTAGQTNLTLEVCRALPLPVPPLAEQAEIVRLLNQQLQALTEQGRAIDRALAMASAQRQNILRAAFSGQLVLQDPNDEPASVLLERIRAQRSAAGDKPAVSRPRKAKIAA